MKKINTIGQENLKYNYRSRNLPHKYDTNKPIFITYRLKFTLPNSILQDLSLKKNAWQKNYLQLSNEEKAIMKKVKSFTNFCWFDELIANSKEIPQLLHRHDLSKIIADAFRYFDNQYYELNAYCIMPNHIHVIITPIIQSNDEIRSLAHITYSWKKYTATQINKILKRKGSLWQQESYDHLIQSEQELSTTVKYIIDNPVKAGLVNCWNEWHGTWIKEDLKQIIE